ncbi:40S ribosomal protein S28e, putative [Plasmodium ovale wallikeri]|uniref:40S ribosomal protein S28e, putative n=1 Tax=Plasmodium ovale wallikeri TaxID=864142 RepID=A0A1A8ZEC9_PLAOA|nr:40S ribosomal protein S28e, putative [Plasmodium ovale wallikeri]SBT42682.1 40S ribosomal protein S28e, putative [Plasmodium ovale wallikeri]
MGDSELSGRFLIRNVKAPFCEDGIFSPALIAKQERTNMSLERPRMCEIDAFKNGTSSAENLPSAHAKRALGHVDTRVSECRHACLGAYVKGINEKGGGGGNPLGESLYFLIKKYHLAYMVLIIYLYKFRHGI